LARYRYPPTPLRYSLTIFSFNSKGYFAIQITTPKS
jgi:hypothetical protein